MIRKKSILLFREIRFAPFPKQYLLNIARIIILLKTRLIPLVFFIAILNQMETVIAKQSLRDCFVEDSSQ